MRTRTNVEALQFIKAMIDGAYRKGAFNDTDSGPLDVHTLVECTSQLNYAAAHMDQMQAAMASAKAASERVAKPCDGCDDKKEDAPKKE